MRFLPFLLAGLLLMACTPTFDWREVDLGGSARLLFPCKPDQLVREVRLAERRLPARMLVCDTRSVTWAATEFELTESADPTVAAALLTQLRHLLSLNLGAEEQPMVEPSPELRTLGADVQFSVLRGQRPGGQTVRARALFFARGHKLYQLVVLLPDENNVSVQGAVEQFFEGARWLAPWRSTGQH